jgi:hypothetical protein
MADGSGSRPSLAEPESVRQEATCFARSSITLVEVLWKQAAPAGDATGVPNLGGIYPKPQSGRESSQHPRRFPPRSPNGTIPAQFATPHPVASAPATAVPF